MSDAIVSSGTTSFVPHPDAHACRWSLLVKPVRAAVGDLLRKLEGAISHAAITGAPPSTNCFLVHGDRGTGKTTVLLSAHEAVRATHQNSNAYWDCVADCRYRDEARTNAIRLAERHVVWLDVLDLEPIPPRANLLTMLLTRIRHALDRDLGEERRADVSEESSYLFSHVERGALHKMQQLISDASLMWEEVTENDTRSVASRRATAADLYARFRENFVGTIATVASEIYFRNTGATGHCTLVLPIDNIDRSVEHLASMVRLAALVSCRQLWLVMAGDRVDLDTFLERAYWKELIRVGEGGGGSGKTDSRGEDEAFVMSRRQAAAASQKLLPQSHRIEVKRVRPAETLAFSLDRANPDRTVGDLLSKLPAPMENANKASQSTGSTGSTPQYFRPSLRLTLKDLLVFPSEIQRDRPVFTTSGEIALTLPARNVIDLWQIANEAVMDSAACQASDDDEKFAAAYQTAERVARTMLRQSIATSTISSVLGRRLQDHIIDRTTDEGTILNFAEWQLRVNRYRGLLYAFDATTKTREYPMRSTLTFLSVSRMILEVLPRAIDAGELQSALRHWELPDVVAGWMSVLHDLAIWSVNSTVIRSDIDTAPIVCVRHELPKCASVDFEPDRPQPPDRSAENERRSAATVPLELRWPAPRWEMFVAHNFFRVKWREYQDRIPSDGSLSLDHVVRNLVVGWLRCSLETFFRYATLLMDHEDDPNWIESREMLVGSSDDSFAGAGDGAMTARDLGAVKSAERLFAYFDSCRNRACSRHMGQRNSWMRLMQNWLEWELALFRTHILVPHFQSPNAEAVWKSYEVSWTTHAPRLTAFWNANWPTIVYELACSLTQRHVGKVRSATMSPTANESDSLLRGYIELLQRVERLSS